MRALHITSRVFKASAVTAASYYVLHTLKMASHKSAAIPTVLILCAVVLASAGFIGPDNPRKPGIGKSWAQSGGTQTLKQPDFRQHRQEKQVLLWFDVQNNDRVQNFDEMNYEMK